MENNHQVLSLNKEKPPEIIQANYVKRNNRAASTDQRITQSFLFIPQNISEKQQLT